MLSHLLILLASSPSTLSSPSGQPSSRYEGRDLSCEVTSDSADGLGFRGKRGLAYNDARQVEYFFASSTMCESCSWAYNWDSRDNGLIGRGLDFVPMLWSPADDHTQRWKLNVENMIRKGSTHVLSFNECDIASQCNRSAMEAADAHVKHMNPLSTRQPGRRRIRMAPSLGRVDVCKEKGCAYDFCPIHWYSFPESTADLFHHIQRASAICGGKPIWLTEFSTLPLSQGGREVAEWLRGQLLKLDLLASLERYAFFMVDGKLVANGLPTPAGAVYAA
ncbi:hypothetical protein BN1723_016380, partial [Verticillium longisporum]